MYLANYDKTTGKILGFYIEGIHANIPQPIKELTKEQHKKFFDKGQCHIIKNDEFIYVEPTELSKDEIKKQKVNIIDLEYQPKFLEITRAWSNANMDGNAELMAEKQTEKQNLIKEYNDKREVILNG